MAIDKDKLRDFAGKQQNLKDTLREAGDEMDEGDMDEEMTEEEIVEEVEGEYEAGGLEDELELTKGYDPEEDGNPPAWAVDEAIWDRAKKAVEDKMDSYDEPWAVVTAIYSRFGGAFK